jgi:hypothetical protein
VRLLAARALLGLAGIASSACSSGWVDLSPPPPALYTSLGPAEGEACATYALALPWHQLFAFGASDRLLRARDAALASVPGATGLVDVTLQERWAYYLLFSRRCAIVRGEAIR